LPKRKQKPNPNQQSLNWEDRRDQGMQDVLDHASELFKRDALEELRLVCEQHARFIGAVFTERARNLPSSTHDLRVIGPLLHVGVKNGWMVPTAEYDKNPNRNGSPARVWRSLILREATDGTRSM
jgi:hypothetical protein